MYRSLSTTDLWSKVVQTAMVSGMVLFVVGAARLLGWVLAVMEVPQTLASSVGGVKPAEVARPLWPYLALMLALTLVIAFLPGVVLFLPNLLGY